MNAQINIEDSPTGQRRADTTVGLWARLGPLIVFVIVVAVSVGATVVTHDIVSDQQTRLLDQRAGELATQTGQSGASAIFKLIAAVYLLQPDNPAAFETIARSVVRGDIAAIGIAQTDGDQMAVRDTVTSGPQLTALTGPRLDAARRALAHQDAAAVLLTDPGTKNRRLFRAVGASERTVIFIELEVDPTRAVATTFSRTEAINAIVYASPTPDPSRVVSTTTGTSTLHGETVARPVTVGDDHWLVVINARGSFVGSFAPTVPWIILVTGLVGACLAAAFAEVLVRRRRYALRLVDERTVALRRTHVELDDARATAEAANRSKSEFLSRMSHELRTPLNAVLGFAQILELEPLTEEQTEAVGHIAKGGEHLLDLINEVLDISRIETGQLALSTEPVHVSEVLDEALDLIRPLLAQNAIRLAEPTGHSCECFVLADRQRLKQILLNLLTNAIKYNRAGGSVTVDCECAAGGPTVRLKVTDTGPGILPEQREMLFVAFERLGAEQTAIEGTGIGLALSRRLAEALGGRLDFESVPGKGSTFWVELPGAEAPIARYDRTFPERPAAQSTPADRKQAVLYIEDNLANLRLIERVFESRPGLSVQAAMQGRIGLDLAREHQPDVILLDLHLPDARGEDILSQLRADPITAHIPVIIVTADATPGQTERLRAAGADATLTKPLDINELLHALDHALGTSSLPTGS